MGRTWNRGLLFQSEDYDQVTWLPPTMLLTIAALAPSLPPKQLRDRLSLPEFKLSQYTA